MKIDEKIIVVIFILITFYFFIYEPLSNNKSGNHNNTNIVKEHKEQKVNNNIVNDHRKIEELINLITCEDRSSKKAIKLVSSVIYNRSKNKTIDDYIKVIKEKYQFSCYDHNTDKIIAQSNNYKDMVMRNYTKFIVNDMINNKFVPIISATHYYAYKKIKKPKWAKKMVVVYKDKNHIYLKE